MEHAEFEPLPELAQDVRRCWIMESPHFQFVPEAILPDPYAQLIINCDAPTSLKLEDGSEVELPRAFINGLQAKPLTLRATGPIHYVAMCLYPWAVAPLVGAETTLGNTSVFVLDGIWNDLAQQISTIVQQRGYADAVECLQQFVSGIKRRLPPDLVPIRTASEVLIASSGRLRVNDLAVRCCLSVSQLERQFKRLNGISPKTFARLIRFEAICNALSLDPLWRVSDLALELGYSDQAHLIHEFKTFSTRTPREFAAGIQAGKLG